MESIDRYRIVRRLGAGSFATVWLGHDDDLDIEVAVKILAENWVDDKEVRRRFIGEARLMRRIRDDRIIRVYDIGTLDDSRPFFVMDYADGGSLNDHRRVLLPPARALRLCADACRAVQVLHDHDVIHRDVTPNNILLNRHGDDVEVVIADLGVAKESVSAAGATMTAGTPAFMAYEQALGHVPLDPRADVYSLAAVTYALLTGRPPFPVKNLAELLQLPPTTAPRPVADRVGGPPELDFLLADALSFDRERRPPSAAHLGVALDAMAARIDEAERTHLARVAPAPAYAGPVPVSPVQIAPLPDPGFGVQPAQPLGPAEPRPDEPPLPGNFLSEPPSIVERAAVRGPLFWTFVAALGIAALAVVVLFAFYFFT